MSDDYVFTLVLIVGGLAVLTLLACGVSWLHDLVRDRLRERRTRREELPPRRRDDWVLELDDETRGW